VSEIGILQQLQLLTEWKAVPLTGFG